MTSTTSSRWNRMRGMPGSPLPMPKLWHPDMDGRDQPDQHPADAITATATIGAETRSGTLTEILEFLIENLGAGGGSGTVTKVNGKTPNGAGEVEVRAADVPVDSIEIDRGEEEDPAVFDYGNTQEAIRQLIAHLVALGDAIENPEPVKAVDVTVDVITINPGEPNEFVLDLQNAQQGFHTVAGYLAEIGGGVAYLSALTEHMVSSSVLILDESAVPRAGVYTTWASMMAQVARINGPVEIVMPNGFFLESDETFDFPARVTFSGNGIPADLGGPTFTVNGAKFTSGAESFLFTDGLTLYQLGTQPIIEVGAGGLVIFLNGASLTGGSVAIVADSGPSPATIALYLGSRFTSIGSALARTEGLTVMSMGPGAVVDAGTLEGPGAIVASYISDAADLHQHEHPGHSGMWIEQLQAVAKFTQFDPTGLALQSTTVQLAIAELAQSLTPMPSAPVGAWFNVIHSAVNTGTTGSPGTSTLGSNNRAVLQYQTFGEDVWVDGFSYYLGAVNDGASAGASLVVWKANGGGWRGPGEVIPFPSAKTAISGPVAEKTVTWSTPVKLPKEGFWYALVFHDLNTGGTNPSYWCHAVTTPALPRPGYSSSPPQGNTRTPILVTTVAGGVPADNPVVSAAFVNSNINIPAISFRKAAAP